MLVATILVLLTLYLQTQFYKRKLTIHLYEYRTKIRLQVFSIKYTVFAE